MDLSKQLESVVAGIVDSVQTRVNDQVANLVRVELKQQLENFDYSTLITQLATEKLTERIAELEFDASAIQRQITAATSVIVENIQRQSANEISTLVNRRVNSIDFGQHLTDSVTNVINARLQTFQFPDNSINASSIRQDEIAISGNQVKSGIIEHFSSTGIDDRATTCVVTILDHAVVVENNLVTLDLTVQGNLDVKGTVPESSEFFKQLTGSVARQVHDSFNKDLFTGFSNTIFDKIKQDGLDLTKITVNQNTVIEGNQLGVSITESNLQKVGQLRELQVKGETLIADSFYVGHKRVGVNTIEPSAALAIWDEEIEITVGKLKDNFGYVSAPRGQTLVLGSNRNQNLTLNPDGSTEIRDLRIGEVKFGSADMPPNFASNRGHLVFNSNPTPGGPIGWVCLGAANWANFGIID